jgi:hypothetical protein
MPKVLEDFPEADPPRIKSEEGLTLPQERILMILDAARGPITRTTITERMGYLHPTAVNDALRSPDPSSWIRQRWATDRNGEKYAIDLAISLFERGYVEEVEVMVSGVKEKGIIITDAGRAACVPIKKKYGGVLPPLSRAAGKRVKKES